MRMKSLTKSLGALALFVAVTVHAQNAPSAPGTPDATVKVSASVKLTVPQMREQITALDAQIQTDVQTMKRLQEVARREKDVVKLTCVNDRLVELKAQQNIYDSANQQFQTTASADGGDAARTSFDELSATAESIKVLRGNAEACIGLPDLYKQESDVNVTHPDFPDDPTTTDPFEPVFEGVEPPGYASPFS